MTLAELDEHRDDAKQHGASVGNEPLVGDVDLAAGIEDGRAFGR